jgi:hypothetical protein
MVLELRIAVAKRIPDNIVVHVRLQGGSRLFVHRFESGVESLTGTLSPSSLRAEYRRVLIISTHHPTGQRCGDAALQTVGGLRDPMRVFSSLVI